MIITDDPRVFVWMVVVLGAVIAVLSGRYLLASDVTLRKAGSVLGTDRPIVARIVCAIGLAIGCGLAIGAFWVNVVRK